MFGEMLREPHPTRRFTRTEKGIAPPRDSLRGTWFEPDYRPRTAEPLAETRAKQEERAVEKEAQVNPLFDGIIRAEGPVREADDHRLGRAQPV
jgi:hypothetical protein